MAWKFFSKKPKSNDHRALFMEQLIFSNRPLFIIIFGIITILLFMQMIRLRPEASFDKMIPTSHPYIKNYQNYKSELKGFGNAVRIAVETPQGDIFNPEYIDILSKINDEVFFIDGVDRGNVRSLWTPVTRWMAVTEEGYDGGPVIPENYSGKPADIEQLRLNVLRSGQIGSLVANNFKSSIIYAPLNDKNPRTNLPLDYQRFSQDLEKVREKYESKGLKIHITGFAKIAGDLIDGMYRMLLFFVLSFLLLLILLYYNSKCWRSTLVRGLSSLLAVIWQMGILSALGYGLNPFSMLVPFLMFALGVSHGIQMFNAMVHAMVDGADKLTGAKLAFRSIFIPGLSALFTDFIGFASLFVINIGVIQDIAIGASIGVVVVAFTDLMLLPVLMSYSGICKKAFDKIASEEKGQKNIVWRRLIKLIRSRRSAYALICIAGVALCMAAYIRQDLRIGDLDPGAPELRPNSRYNLDNRFMNDNFNGSSDIFIVMIKTPKGMDSRYATLVATNRLQWQLENLPCVLSTQSLASEVEKVLAGFNEGNFKWWSLTRNEQVLMNASAYVAGELVNREGSLSLLRINLRDHKAETLTKVVNIVEAFAAENNTKEVEFLLAAGNSGIEAATNIEVEKAHRMMTILVYTAVFFVCTITFRGIRPAICVLLPLYLTSVLCEAAMTMMGIGIKVATLPVIAVGVGIGVDYGIYIYNKLQYYLNSGRDLEDAYYKTLNTTGRAVTFTGIALSIGVGTWAFSSIKFQADMGILLAFMFLVNMLGALMLVPALIRILFKTDFRSTIINH